MTNFDKCSRNFDTDFDVMTYTLENTNHLNSDLSIVINIINLIHKLCQCRSSKMTDALIYGHDREIDKQELNQFFFIF